MPFMEAEWAPGSLKQVDAIEEKTIQAPKKT